MNFTRATPQTLTQAIDYALKDISQSSDLRVNANNVIRQHVKDFLAQRFGAVMIEAEDSEAKRLKILFDLITETPDGKQSESHKNIA